MLDVLKDAMAIVTVEEMTEAIKRTLVAHGKIPASLAEKVALQVLSYFGAEEAILDNVLSNEDRDVFYWLEEEGLLSSEEEDAIVEKGRSWRIHYWLLNKAAIQTPKDEKPSKDEDSTAIYDHLSTAEWHRSDAPGKTVTKKA
jgi:hypothetical protein